MLKSSILFVAALFLLSACAQVQNDGARSLENANEVVSSAGGKAWTGTPKDNQKKEAKAAPATR